MKKHITTYILALVFILGMGMVSCSDRDDEIKDLELDRVLTPYKLEAEITNAIDLTLTWKSRAEANGYIIEIYADDMEFKAENLVHMDEVLVNLYEYKNALLGDMQYSARVKSVSVDNDDSKWAGIAFKTSFKSVFLPRQEGDLTKNSAIFRWPAGMKATKLELLVDGELGVSHTLTADEIAKGIAEVVGLLENTRYSATLYNEDKRLGETDITTPLDVGDAIIVNNAEELKEKLAAANDGDLFLLMEGVYDLSEESLAITKSISIVGREDHLPTLKGRFDLDNLNKVEFKYLIMDGTKSDGSLQDYPFSLQVKDSPYGDISMEGLQVRNYGKTLISAGSSFVTSINSINIHNCIIGEIKGSGNAAIDMRNGLVETLSVTNSTLYNVSTGFDFIRIDNKFSSSATAKFIFENCTIHNVASTGKKFFYVRYPATYSVKNTIFSNMGTAKLLDSSSAFIDGEGNNYHEATGIKAQDKGTFTEHDPEYLDANNGDFTIGSSSVLVGDPQWIK